MSDLHHSIKMVARKTGLTPHVIRVWERRYGAVTPTRTETNRRLYSDDEVMRLALLRQAIQAGHSIGNIAQLPTDQLSQIAADSKAAESTEASPQVSNQTIIDESLKAIRALNTAEFEDALSKGIVALGQHGLLEKVIGPLAWQLGELWRQGEILAAHEHFASTVIRNFLGQNSKPFAANSNAPTLVVTTPSGQLHELGAVMVAAAANDLGWRVIYLGPSLPAADIGAAATQHQARAVALSIVYPEDDPNLPAELENLRKYLPAETRIIAGGRAAAAYSATLTKIGATRATQLKELYTALDALRVSGSRPQSTRIH
jgi:DNA-binding transcriptional MerR regulator/methylmalonyl-CoA mutase cobalamin-binding subunit